MVLRYKIAVSKTETAMSKYFDKVSVTWVLPLFTLAIGFLTGFFTHVQMTTKNIENPAGLAYQKTEKIPTKPGLKELFDTRPLGKLEEPANTGPPIKIVSEVELDYDQSLKEAIAAGNYDVAEDNITEAHFPRNKEEQKKKRVSFKLLCFNQKIKYWEAPDKIKEEKCRPATLRELLAFGRANPELTRRLHIVALGSTWYPTGTNLNCVVRFSGGYYNKELAIYYHGNRVSKGIYLSNVPRMSDDWFKSCYFLAVPVKK